ncbi:MAG: hypothetical protein KDC90_05535 [Ignavibacteriae bacterium]|nr:hypothetical protein [Ignavibacteriota bacterium]
MKILISIAFLFFSTTFIAQGSTLKKAMKTPDRNGIYSAEFKVPEKKVDIEKWILENKLVLLSYKEGSIQRFADIKEGIVLAQFTSIENYYHLVELEKQKQAAAREAENEGFWGTVLAVGAFVVAGVAAYSYIKSNAPSSYSSSGYSSSPSYSSSSTISSKISSCNLGDPVETSSTDIHCNDRYPVYKLDCGKGKLIYYSYLPNNIDCGILNVAGKSKGYYEYLGVGLVQLAQSPYFNTDYNAFVKKLCGCE